VKCILKEAFEMHPGSHDEPALFVKHRVSLAESASFAIAMKMLHYAPAFVISPNEQYVSPRDTFLSGASVLLCSHWMVGQG
jgi:hypothetical protein